MPICPQVHTSFITPNVFQQTLKMIHKSEINTRIPAILSSFTREKIQPPLNENVRGGTCSGLAALLNMLAECLRVMVIGLGVPYK